MGHFGVDQAGSRCWPAVRRASSFVSIFAVDRIEDNGACFIVRDQGGPKARLRLLRGGGRPTLVESGDWFGSSLLGRRLDKCFATALGNHVKSRMPTPLDVLSAHQIRNFGTSTGSQRPHNSSVLASSGQLFQ
jgi:hypothetical protein